MPKAASIELKQKRQGRGKRGCRFCLRPDMCHRQARHSRAKRPDECAPGSYLTFTFSRLGTPFGQGWIGSPPRSARGAANPNPRGRPV
jgi:hypothetical protein